MKPNKFKKLSKFTKPPVEMEYRLRMDMQGGKTVLSKPFIWDGKKPIHITVGDLSNKN
jgi:hypothetical protein